MGTNSGSDKNYLHFTLRPFVPREARPLLKVDRDGEMFVTTAPAPAPAPAVTVPETGAVIATTVLSTVAVPDVTNVNAPAPKRHKVQARRDKYAEGGPYMSVVDEWMASGIECEWI